MLGDVPAPSAPAPDASTARTALALAGIALGLGATLAYVAQRTIDHLRGAVVDPTLIVLQAHTPFFWRALTATWWGGLLAILVYVAARRRAAATTRSLSVAVPVVAILAVVLSWMLP